MSLAVVAFASGLLATASPPPLASLLVASELDDFAGRDGRMSGISPKEIVENLLGRELSSVRRKSPGTEKKTKGTERDLV